MEMNHHHTYHSAMWSTTKLSSHYMEFHINKKHDTVNTSCRNTSINGRVWYSLLYRQLITDIIQTTKILIHAFTDNQSLHDTINTTKQILDRRLRVEISALIQMCDKNKVTVNWLSKHHQLSDVLTKKGASYHQSIARR